MKMVQTCSIKNCKIVWSPSSTISFHCFPKDDALRKKWFNNIPADLINKDISSSSFICSQHFTPDCFIPSLTLSTNNKLIKYAIPTIFRDSKVYEEYNIENLRMMIRNSDYESVQNNFSESDEDSSVYEETEEKKSISKRTIGIQTSPPGELSSLEISLQKEKKRLKKRIRRLEKILIEMRDTKFFEEFGERSTDAK